MGYDLAAWLNLCLRWLHVIAAVAWIGASFYFVWLDNNLQPPDPPAEGVKGELWAVHGGGFYNSRKFLAAPSRPTRRSGWAPRREMGALPKVRPERGDNRPV